MENLLEVSVLVFAVGLQNDSDDGHERFDHTKLQSGLFTEPQEANGVGFPSQTAGTVHTAGPKANAHMLKITLIPRKGEIHRKSLKYFHHTNKESFIFSPINKTVNSR